MLKGILPINTLSTIAGLGTAISSLPATAAVLLAMATGVGIATAPAQAATITYSCPNGQVQGYCTLQQLFNGGAIRVDENDDNKIDKEFDNWVNLTASILTSTRAANVRVSASGTATPLATELTFNVLNNAITFTTQQITNYIFQHRVNVPNPDLRLTREDLALTQAVFTGSGSVPGGIGAITVTNASASSPSISVQVAQDDLPPKQDFTLLNSLTSMTVNNTISGYAVNFPPFVTNSMSTLQQYKTKYTQLSYVVAIPEPSAVVGLLAFCSLGLGMKRKQRDS